MIGAPFYRSEDAARAFEFASASVEAFSDSLGRKLKSVFGERVAKDAGNPSGARNFTISTALGNNRGENNEHKYDEARP
jgi:hypothetical protein